MEFEWDPKKNEKNISKHGLSFEQAKTIFNRESYYYQDKRFDYKEERYIVIGPTEAGAIILVVFTVRRDKIRLISARKTNKKEQNLYHDEIRKGTNS